MDTARKTMCAWLERRGGTLNDFVFPRRNDYMTHISTSTIVSRWVRVRLAVPCLAGAAAVREQPLMVTRMLNGDD